MSCRCVADAAAYVTATAKTLSAEAVMAQEGSGGIETHSAQSIWYVDLVHPFPVVHEYRSDSCVVTHIRPSGGKSATFTHLFHELLTREEPK